MRDGVCGEGRIHAGCIMNSGGGAWGRNVGQRWSGGRERVGEEGAGGRGEEEVVVG